MRWYINTMNENYIIELAEYDENGNTIQPQYKRVPSILEYIVNHRQDILEKVAKERNEIMTSSTQITNINKKPHVIITKNTYYRKLICWYLLFMCYGLTGGIFINFLSSMPLFNYDMWFNVIVSPIIYYHSPRNILLHIRRIDFIRFYTLPFIGGLFFRFLDRIPGVSQFVMDPMYIHSTIQIALLCVTSFIIILLAIYYIYISANPLINSTIFIAEL